MKHFVRWNFRKFSRVVTLTRESTHRGTHGARKRIRSVTVNYF